MQTNNPLRYPGAKSKLVPYIQKLLETEHLNGCTFLEAYGGSAAVSFGLLEQEMVDSVKINELDPLIYSFWYCVMNHTEELVQMIIRTDITIDNWNEYSKYRNAEYLANKSIIQIGFAGLFLNRTNFSGILNANPLGGKQQTSKYKIDCRFNKIEVIKNIRKLSEYADKVELYNMDAISFLQQETRYKRNRSIFVYIDPPYYEKGPSLYRFYYNNDAHKKLSSFIKTKTYPWLISYDDTPEIRKLYRRRRQQQIYLDYSANTRKQGEELLISNLEIPPLENTTTNETSLFG